MWILSPAWRYVNPHNTAGKSEGSSAGPFRLLSSRDALRWRDDALRRAPGGAAQPQGYVLMWVRAGGRGRVLKVRQSREGLGPLQPVSPAPTSLRAHACRTCHYRDCQDKDPPNLWDRPRLSTVLPNIGTAEEGLQSCGDAFWWRHFCTASHFGPRNRRGLNRMGRLSYRGVIETGVNRGEDRETSRLVNSPAINI